ncbi:MAG: hypothetical protein V3S16_06840, partial [Candidatus Desulfatibia sp.]|uniref:hypothetical protein n=1 Tax=Candidatus Desulfatibia sp. TaxID=3101189 RepID=UPI002F34D830
MIVPHRLNILKEAIDFLNRQYDLIIKRIPNCKLTLDNNSDEEQEKERIIRLLENNKGMVSGIYDQVKEYNSSELLAEVSVDDQIVKLVETENTLRKVRKDLEDIVGKHYEAKLGPNLREISKSIDAVYSEFVFLVPNILYEIEIIEDHFRNPLNAEKTIMPDLQESINHFKKKRISFEEFLNGFKMGNKNFKGFKYFRTVDSVFSPFQSYENMPDKYDQINGCIYNICKSLESFMKEFKNDKDFVDVAEKFENIKRKTTVTRKTASTRGKKNVSTMSEVFDVYNVLGKIFRKMAVKYSFRDEYTKSTLLFKDYEKLTGELVSYDTGAIDAEVNTLIDATQDENAKKQIGTLIEEVRELIHKKRLPLERLSWLLQQIKAGNYNIVVMEREMEELTIPITPHIAEKYGENNLKEINLIIEEIDFWLHGTEKQEKYNNV